MSLHRLEQCYPSSLKAFDAQYPCDGEHEDEIRPVSDLTLHYPILVANLARMYNFVTPLPTALYLRTQFNNATLLQGVRAAIATGTDLDRLTLDDIEMCLDAREKSLRARIKAIAFMADTLIVPSCRKASGPSGSCLHHREKGHLPVVNLGQQIRNLSIDRDVLAPLTYKMSGHKLCAVCFRTVCDRYDEERRQIWGTLGDVFGVDSWWSEK